jgi:hypothetical protein
MLIPNGFYDWVRTWRDVYAKSWSKCGDTHFLRLAEALGWPWFRSRTSTFASAAAAICSGSFWRCLGSLRERSFCTHGISNPDECDLQKKKANQMIDWAIDIWCGHAQQRPMIKIDWVRAAWRLVNVYNSFASRSSESARHRHRILRVVAPVAEKMHEAVTAAM